MQFTYERREIEDTESYMNKLNEWGKDGWELIYFNRTTRTVIIPMSGTSQMYNTTHEKYIECLLKKAINNK